MPAHATVRAMNVAFRQAWTLELFLTWEQQQELRYEFDGFQPVAMAGGTYAHDTIAMNLAAELRNRLRGTPCRPHGSNLKIEVMGRVRYPDAYVTCGTYQRDSKFGHDPVVIFEVLSDDDPNRDLVEKNQEYRATPSVQRYVVLEQTSAAALVFARKGTEWISEIVAGADAILRLPEIGIEIPLTELYDGIDLSAAAAGGEPEPTDQTEG